LPFCLPLFCSFLFSFSPSFCSSSRFTAFCSDFSRSLPQLRSNTHSLPVIFRCNS
jgi:hypothetical protein